MNKTAMADITYLGRGAIKITIGSPPRDLREIAALRGYKSPLKNSSFSKVVSYLEWQDEFAWLLANRNYFQKEDLKILKGRFESIERVVKKDLPPPGSGKQKFQEKSA